MRGEDRNLRLKRKYRLLRRARFSEGQGTQGSAKHSYRTRAARHANPTRYRLLKSATGFAVPMHCLDVER